MSLKVENLEKNMAKLTLEATAEELEGALQKAYQMCIRDRWNIL